MPLTLGEINVLTSILATKITLAIIEQDAEAESSACVGKRFLLRRVENRQCQSSLTTRTKWLR